MQLNPIRSLLLVVIVEVNRQFSKGQVLKESDSAKHGIIMIESIHRAGQSVIILKACARTRHAPTFVVTLTAVRLLFLKRNNGIFCALQPYLLWAYFIKIEQFPYYSVFT